MNTKKNIDYQKYLIGSLKSPEGVAGYLNAALEGEIRLFFF